MHDCSFVEFEKEGVQAIRACQDTRLSCQNDCAIIGFHLVPFHAKGGSGNKPAKQDHKQEVVNPLRPEKPEKES